MGERCDRISTEGISKFLPNEGLKGSRDRIANVVGKKEEGEEKRHESGEEIKIEKDKDTRRNK